MKAGTHIDIRSLVGAGEGWFAGLCRRLHARAMRIFGDETLMRRARAGDAAAFAALVSRYRGRLHAVAFDSLDEDMKRGDVLSETVLAAFENLDSFGAKCTPGTWLYLHGFRAVFRRMDALADGDASENSSAAVASREQD